MSRLLFAWELGANLGHLTRDLPVAEKLREAGHEVVFSVRDTRVAAEVLSASRFQYVQAPIIVGAARPAEPPANYAELLMANAWSERVALRGHLSAWLNILAMGRFDALIADHAPGALVAARIAGIAAIPLGNGFEIPPDMEPMPTIYPWRQHTEHRLMASQQKVLADINALVTELGGKPYVRLGEMFSTRPIFGTFAELDHYGQRSGACYVGSIHGLNQAPEVSWPPGEGPRVVMYLRSNHPATAFVMAALADLGVRALCVIPGANAQFKAKSQTTAISIVSHPVALGPLLASADALIGYASIGTMSEALLKGVPLLMIPTTVEQYLVGKRAEVLGAGILVDGAPDGARIRAALAALLGEARFKDSAQAFATRYTEVTPERAAEDAARRVTELIS
jgi:UDP:flavonoid glycosyltransferase YjiC (YdhE family)